jgi:hypothetical protein
MSIPIAPLSLHEYLSRYAAPPHPTNLPAQPTTMRRIMYPQISPVLRRPMLVLSPDKTKY